MLYEERVTSNRVAFVSKVESICNNLKIAPEWLMQVMVNESGVNHQAVNSISNATGLIQFMPNTAIALGTTVAALKAMSNVQQLDYVYKYLAPYAGKINSYIDLYFAVFFPSAIGKPDEWVLQTSTLSASKIAAQNPVFDLNKDGKLTVAEVREAMLRKVPSEWQDFFLNEKQNSSSEQEQLSLSQQQQVSSDGGTSIKEDDKKEDHSSDILDTDRVGNVGNAKKIIRRKQKTGG